MKPVNIAGRLLGPRHPCFVVAEAGVNHNGNPELARRLIDAAVEAGVDAVKFQTFQADRLATATAPTAAYQRTGAATERQHDILRGLELPASVWSELAARCAQRGVVFLSTPFDEESVAVLDGLGVAAFKVSSADLTNLPLLSRIAGTHKPVILSTGHAYLSEVEQAVRVVQDGGAGGLVLLHCVSAYPAQACDANLRAMRTLADAFDVPVGFSDHTLGIDVPLAAVALGACVIEKHVTLDCALPGPDHRASLEPSDLARMVGGIRAVEAALGTSEKRPMPSEADVRHVARRSLCVRADVEPGTVVRSDMLVALRPAGGIDPMQSDRVIGRRIARRRAAGTALEWADLE